MNKQKAIRLIAFISLGLMVTFSITVVMVFLNFGGMAVILIAGISGGGGVILFITMKVLMREPSNPDKERPVYLDDFEELPKDPFE